MPIPMPARAGDSHVSPLHRLHPPCPHQAPIAGDQQAELEAAQLALPRLRQLAAEHPSWMADLDLIEPAGDLQGLLELLGTAPNEFAAGMAFGMFAIRAQEIAMGRVSVGAGPCRAEPV